MAAPKKGKVDKEANIEEAIYAEVPTTPYVQDMVGQAPTPITSVDQLDLHFRKVELKSDINNLLVASTDKEFFVNERKYSGTDYFIVMFGPGQIHVVEKSFFNLIAKII